MYFRIEWRNSHLCYHYSAETCSEVLYPTIRKLLFITSCLPVSIAILLNDRFPLFGGNENYYEMVSLIFFIKTINNLST